MISVSPARCAASSFCLTPPIGSTRPCSVTSPVIPTLLRTGRPVRRLTLAAGAGHGQPGRDAWYLGPLRGLRVESGSTQVGSDIVAVDMNRRSDLSGFDLRRGLSQEAAEGAFQVADAGLECVLGNDPANG